jgi:hypothetical protein
MLVSKLGMETRSSLMPSGIRLAASSFDTSFDNVKRCGCSGVCGNNSSADFPHPFRMVLKNLLTEQHLIEHNSKVFEDVLWMPIA